MRDAIVHDEMDVEFARYGRLDLVRELAELSGAVAPVTLADDPSGRNIEGGELKWTPILGPEAELEKGRSV